MTTALRMGNCREEGMDFAVSMEKTFPIALQAVYPPIMANGSSARRHPPPMVGDAHTGSSAAAVVRAAVSRRVISVQPDGRDAYQRDEQEKIPLRHALRRNTVRFGDYAYQSVGEKYHHAEQEKTREAFLPCNGSFCGASGASGAVDGLLSRTPGKKDSRIRRRAPSLRGDRVSPRAATP